MYYIILIISFFMEGIFTNLVSFNSLFIPLFTLTSMVISYDFIGKTEKNLTYILSSFIIGIVYDIAYTNSVFINTFAFVICATFIIIINKYIRSNILSRTCINLFIIIIYRIITYLLLVIFKYFQFSFNSLFRGIYSSIISNIIYGIFLYFICNKILKKLNLRKYKI